MARPKKRSLRRPKKRSPTRRSRTRRLSAGAYVGHGEQSCIVTTTDPGLVLRISRKTDEQEFEEARTEVEITRSLRRFDPLQTRFVSADLFTLMAFDEFTRRYPAEAADYEVCREEARDRSVPPKNVMLSTTLRCDPLGELTQYDIAYLTESIKILGQLDISHADIHNKNVMRRNGNPVLIDWGKSQTHMKSKGFQELDTKSLAATKLQNMGEQLELQRRQAAEEAREERGTVGMMRSLMF